MRKREESDSIVSAGGGAQEENSLDLPVGSLVEKIVKMFITVVFSPQRSFSKDMNTNSE